MAAFFFITLPCLHPAKWLLVLLAVFFHALTFQFISKSAKAVESAGFKEVKKKYSVLPSQVLVWEL
jgi:hypothetical protein